MGITHSKISGEPNPGDGRIGGEDWDDSHVGIPARVTRTGTRFEDDLMIRVSTDTYDGGVGPVTSGTGAAVTSAGNAGADTVNHIGQLRAECGSTTTGRAALTSGIEVLFGGGQASFGSVSQLRVLSDGTNTYTARIGWYRFGSGDGTDGVFFRYTHSVNSGKWEAVTRSNSSETTDDTGVTATANTTGGADYHTFEAVVNAAASSVEFFIDGVSVSTISATIPSGSGSRVTQMTPAAINGSAGTSSLARSIFCDAYWYEYEFDTPR